MLVSITHCFTKITGFIAAWFCFRTKVYYEDRKVQSRHISGPAIVIANHTSVFDYAVLIFVFLWRNLRCMASEIIFQKPILGRYIKLLGGIRVDRNTHHFGFLTQSEQILRRGGVITVFPESRIPQKGEKTPLPFKPSAAYLALCTGVPVIPCYTNGCYFSKKRARVMIGAPIDPQQFADPDLSDKENINRLNDALRQKIIALEELLYEQI